MVQGEKQSGAIMAIGNVGRTNDPSARKAGYEAVSFSSSSKSSSSSSSNQQQQTVSSQYGSWGPVFKNKSTFGEMHFC